MKNLTVTKFQRVENTDSQLLQNGIIAFQLVKMEYRFYGSKQTDVLDTKIMKDGRQIVIDGNGFIKAGYEIN